MRKYVIISLHDLRRSQCISKVRVPDYVYSRCVPTTSLPKNLFQSILDFLVARKLLFAQKVLHLGEETVIRGHQDGEVEWVIHNISSKWYEQVSNESDSIDVAS